MNLNDTEKMIQTQWIRIHYITDIVSAITSTKSRCCKKVKCSVTTGWQRPARHRRESGATCSRVTILTGGRDLVDMGNNGAFACRRAGSSLSESVSRSISRVHQRPLSRSVRTTQWTCLFWSSCAALFRTMRPRERERAACIRRTGRFSILLFVESRFRSGRSIAIDISQNDLHLMILLRKV